MIKNNMIPVLVVVFNFIIAQQPFGKISLPLGKVDVSTAENKWSRAKPNQPVFEGNVIRTQVKSRCEITLTGGGRLRIGEQSELELNEADVKPMAKSLTPI